MNEMLAIAMKLLSSRSCSEREVRRHLEKEFAALPEVDTHIEESIARLRELQVINDNRLAQSVAQRYSHKGNRFIAQTLKQKGVADDVIAGVLASLDDEYSRALDEARRKGNRGTWTSAEDVKTGLAHFLSGRGFSHEAIKAVMSELCDEGFFKVRLIS